MTVISVFGVWAWSLPVNRPPKLMTVFGQVAPGMNHRALSISWTPWLPMSPLPKSQNQCQR